MTLLSMAQTVALQTDEELPLSTVEGLTQGSTTDWVIRIVNAINEGYKKVFKRAYSNELAEVSGSFSVSASPFDVSSYNLLRIIELDVAGYKPITIMNWQEFKQSYYNQPNTPQPYGYPNVAALWGGKIYFDVIPYPSAPYTLNYSAHAGFVPLALNVSVPLVDEDILINYALYKVHSYNFDPRASMAFADYQSCLDSYLSSLKSHLSICSQIMPEDAYYE